jgi:hypothetical protein
MDWNPTKKYRKLLSLIDGLLSTDEKRTARDLYYALTARGHNYDYDEVSYAVKMGRRSGKINPELIIDTSRNAATTVNEGYASPENFLNTVVDEIWDQYYENVWEDQQVYIEIWLEKAALVNFFKPICQKYNVRLEATRGDWSDSRVYRTTKRLKDQIQQGNDVVVLHYGDYNPSGFHVPVSIQERMAHYGLVIRDPKENITSEDKLYFDIWPPDSFVEFEDSDGRIKFERVALCGHHINEHDLPQNPTPSSSKKDRTIRDGFHRHVTGGTDADVELNALKEYRPNLFKELIETSITKHLDMEARKQTLDRIKSRKKLLRAAISIDRSQLEAYDNE